MRSAVHTVVGIAIAYGTFRYRETANVLAPASSA